MEDVKLRRSSSNSEQEHLPPPPAEAMILGLESNVSNGQMISFTLSGDKICEVSTTKECIVAGPTNPLVLRRVQSLKPQKFSDEPLDLICEWVGCDFKTVSMEIFMDHVAAHLPAVAVTMVAKDHPMKVILSCNWKFCPWNTDKTSEDFLRHLYLHAYHSKLKCIGMNTLERSGATPCRADSSNRNILPDLSENLLCAWGSCSEQFTNIQRYYDHIRDHTDSCPRGKNVPGGITCKWTACSSVFPNCVKLRDHMRSHTQEKLVACPNCGGLFSNRTRFFDHCSRQLLEIDTFACEVCLKTFPTARLLRDHIRSHINTYKCHMCEMSCASPSALNNHLKYKHCKDKPFACSYCDYACKSHSDLQRHFKKHSRSVYQCEVENCAFQAKSLEGLKTHWAKSHTDSKLPQNYCCHLCDKRFRKGNYLTKHLTAVHKLQWPAGHSRFRYKLNEDGVFRLLTVRYESIEDQT